MANGSNVLEILVRAQNQVGPGLASAQQQIQGFSQSVSTAFSAIGRSLVVFKAFDVAADSMKQFVGAEAGMRALQASLESVGADVGKVTAQAEQLIAAWERASVFDDDELRAAFTNLVTITGQAEGSFGAMQAAMDLAAARGIALSTATELIGRAVEGNVGALSRYGIKFDEASAKAFKFGSELDRIAVIAERAREGMGGRATAELDTYLGKIQLVKNAWGDAQESIGKFLVSGIAGIVEFGEKLGYYADKVGNFFRRLRGAEETTLRLPGVESGGRSSIGIQAAADAARAHSAAEEARQNALRASEKAAQDAARAAEQYAKDLDALTFSGAAAAREQRLLSDAVRRFGDTAKALNVDAIRQRYVEWGDAATQAGKTMTDAFRGVYEAAKSIEATTKVDWDKVFGEAEFERMRQKILRGELGGIALKVVRLNIEPAVYDRIHKDLEKTLAEAGSRGLEDAFADFALTGGANLSAIIEGLIAEGARAGAKALVDILGEALRPGAAARLTQEPGESNEAFAKRRQGAGADLAGRIGATVGLGIGGIQGIQANQAGQMNDTQTIMSQVAIGASIGSIWPGIGTIIGAAVGLIIGGISAIMSDAGKDDRYGILSIQRGQARFAPGQNIGLKEAEEIQQRAQGIWNTTYDGFAKVLLKLQDFVPDFIRNMTVNFTRGLEAGGYVGREASPNFMKHLDRLITEGIPSEVGKQFRPVFDQAFQAMGFTTERFNEIWDDLAEMDATKGIQLLGMLADAIVSLKKSMADFSTEVGVFDVRGDPTSGSLLARAQTRSQESFADSLRRTDAEILRLAGSLDSLTTEGQIQTLNQIADLEAQRQQSILAFLQQTLAIVKQFNAQIEGGVSELELRGLTDPQERIDYLEAQIQADRQLLLTAQTPEQAREIANRIYGNIFRIIDEAAALGPEAQESFRLWGIDALRGLQGDFNARINVLLDDINARNREFMDAWQPIYQDWMTQLQGATAPLNAFGGEVDRTRGRLIEFQGALEGATQAARNNAAAGGPGGGGGETVIITGDDSGGASIDAYVTDIRTRRGLRGMA